jgi:large subunit ribosomal protein L5
MAEFKKLYEEKIVKELTDEFHYSSRMQVPKLDKIVVNIGVGDGAHDEKYIDAAVRELAEITGQKPIVTKAKNSIAGFKIREGNSIGAKVTLRGENMYLFLEKIVKIVLPSVRDFRGISSKSFDGHGNYTLGLKDQLVFPEVVYDEVVKVRGMDIVFVTTAKTNEEALKLLSGFGMPFRK